MAYVCPHHSPEDSTHAPTHTGEKCRFDLHQSVSFVASSRARSCHRQRWQAPSYHMAHLCCTAEHSGGMIVYVISALPVSGRLSSQRDAGPSVRPSSICTRPIAAGATSRITSQATGATETRWCLLMLRPVDEAALAGRSADTGGLEVKERAIARSYRGDDRPDTLGCKKADFVFRMQTTQPRRGPHRAETVSPRHPCGWRRHCACPWPRPGCGPCAPGSSSCPCPA